MLTIDDYCDRAIARHDHITSDRGLGRALGFSGAPVTFWRCKRAWPSPETMVRLAMLAGLDREQALLDLGIWSAKSPEVRSAYSRMAEKVNQGVRALLIVGGLSWLLGAPGPANAAGTGEPPISPHIESQI